MHPPYNKEYIPRNVKGIWRGWGYFIVPNWNIVIAAPPKCGSSSLKQFFHINEMNDVAMIPRSQVNPSSDIYFVVRHPEERFKSLWKSKCRDQTPILRREVYGMSPDELMDFIIAGPEDIHWTPQTKILGKLNATLIPLPKLNDFFEGRKYGALPIFNNTKGDVDITLDLQKRIREYYINDYLLYHSAERKYEE